MSGIKSNIKDLGKAFEKFKKLNESEQKQPATTEVHISQIKSGDTVIHEGQICTVTNSDLKHSEFMGITLFGDCYALGHKPVIKVLSFHKTPNL